MTHLSKKILALLAGDRDATMEAGRKARALAFDLQEKKQLVVDALVDLADGGLVAIWHPFVDDVARYRISDAGQALYLPRPAVSAAFALMFSAFLASSTVGGNWSQEAHIATAGDMDSGPLPIYKRTAKARETAEAFGTWRDGS